MIRLGVYAEPPNGAGLRLGTATGPLGQRAADRRGLRSRPRGTATGPQADARHRFAGLVSRGRTAAGPVAGSRVLGAGPHLKEAVSGCGVDGRHARGEAELTDEGAVEV